MAGESARAVARSKRQRAERLLRDAEKFERGAEGEAETARALTALPVGTWHVIHDVRWPGRRFANIDHVVVGPGGVFVIDSKHWSGSIEVTKDVLRQNGRQRESSVAAAADAALAVAELLPGVHPNLVRPVLCFVRDVPVTGWAREVAICSPPNLAAMLLTRDEVLTPDQVTSTFRRLLTSMTAATSPAPQVARWAGVPRGSAGPVPVKARRPAKKRRSGASALVAVAVIAGLLLFGNQLLDGVTKGIVRVVVPEGSVQVGDTVTVTGSAERPTLELTASRVVRTRPKAGPKGRTGAKAPVLTGVSLRIKNVGDRPWRSLENAAFSLGADNYQSYSADSRLKRLAAGRVLPADFKVAPGHTVEGLVAFDVPRGAVPTRVTARIGPGQPELVSWQVKDPAPGG